MTGHHLVPAGSAVSRVWSLALASALSAFVAHAADCSRTPARLLAYTLFSDGSARCRSSLLWLLLAGLVLLNIDALRIRFITRPFLRTYRRLLPSMSHTEKEALEAGTVWWDGELFTGGPDWEKLLSGRRRRGSPPKSRRSSTAPAKSCAACSTTGTSRTGSRRPAAGGLGLHQVARASSR